MPYMPRARKSTETDHRWDGWYNKYNTNGEINLKVEKKKSSLGGKKRTERWTYSGNDIGRLFNFNVIIAKANTGTLLNSECKVP